MSTPIVTPFGEFNVEDEVKVVSTGLLGAITEVEGTVLGERNSMGIQYLLIKEEKTSKEIEFPMSGGFVSYVEESKKLSLPANEVATYNRVGQ